MTDENNDHVALMTQFKEAEQLFICGICLEVVKDPVRISCLHKFCYDCINENRAKEKGHVICPHCRERYNNRAISKDGFVEKCIGILKNIEEAIHADTGLAVFTPVKRPTHTREGYPTPEYVKNTRGSRVNRPAHRDRSKNSTPVKQSTTRSNSENSRDPQTITTDFLSDNNSTDESEPGTRTPDNPFQAAVKVHTWFEKNEKMGKRSEPQPSTSTQLPTTSDDLDDTKVCTDESDNDVGIVENNVVTKGTRSIQSCSSSKSGSTRGRESTKLRKRQKYKSSKQTQHQRKLKDVWSKKSAHDVAPSDAPKFDLNDTRSSGLNTTKSSWFKVAQVGKEMRAKENKSKPLNISIEGNPAPKSKSNKSIGSGANAAAGSSSACSNSEDRYAGHSQKRTTSSLEPLEITLEDCDSPIDQNMNIDKLSSTQIKDIIGVSQTPKKVGMNESARADAISTFRNTRTKGGRVHECTTSHDEDEKPAVATDVSKSTSSEKSPEDRSISKLVSSTPTRKRIFGNWLEILDNSISSGNDDRRSSRAGRSRSGSKDPNAFEELHRPNSRITPVKDIPMTTRTLSPFNINPKDNAANSNNGGRGVTMTFDVLFNDNMTGRESPNRDGPISSIDARNSTPRKEIVRGVATNTTPSRSKVNFNSASSLLNNGSPTVTPNTSKRLTSTTNIQYQSKVSVKRDLANDLKNVNVGSKDKTHRRTLIKDEKSSSSGGSLSERHLKTTARFYKLGRVDVSERKGVSQKRNPAQLRRIPFYKFGSIKSWGTINYVDAETQVTPEDSCSILRDDGYRDFVDTETQTSFLGKNAEETKDSGGREPRGTVASNSVKRRTTFPPENPKKDVVRSDNIGSLSFDGTDRKRNLPRVIDVIVCATPLKKSAFVDAGKYTAGSNASTSRSGPRSVGSSYVPSPEIQTIREFRFEEQAKRKSSELYEPRKRIRSEPVEEDNRSKMPEIVTADIASCNETDDLDARDLKNNSVIRRRILFDSEDNNGPRKTTDEAKNENKRKRRPSNNSEDDIEIPDIVNSWVDGKRKDTRTGINDNDNNVSIISEAPSTGNVPMKKSQDPEEYEEAKDYIDDKIWQSVNEIKERSVGPNLNYRDDVRKLEPRETCEKQHDSNNLLSDASVDAAIANVDTQILIQGMKDDENEKNLLMNNSIGNKEESSQKMVLSSKQESGEMYIPSSIDTSTKERRRVCNSGKENQCHGRRKEFERVCIKSSLDNNNDGEVTDVREEKLSSVQSMFEHKKQEKTLRSSRDLSFGEASNIQKREFEEGKNWHGIGGEKDSSVSLSVRKKSPEISVFDKNSANNAKDSQESYFNITQEEQDLRKFREEFCGIGASSVPKIKDRKVGEHLHETIQKEDGTPEVFSKNREDTSLRIYSQRERISEEQGDAQDPDDNFLEETSQEDLAGNEKIEDLSMVFSTPLAKSTQKPISLNEQSHKKPKDSTDLEREGDGYLQTRNQVEQKNPWDDSLSSQIPTPEICNAASQITADRSSNRGGTSNESVPSHKKTGEFAIKTTTNDNICVPLDAAVGRSKSGQRSFDKEKLRFVGSKLTTEQMKKVELLAKKLGATFQKNFTTEVSHVIVTRIDGKSNRVDQTLKYIEGITYEKWVVVFEWVERCLNEGRIVDEEPYEATDCSGFPGPRRSRLRSNLLFKDFVFHCIKPITYPTLEQYKKILEANGGTVIKSLPEFAAHSGKLKMLIMESDYHKKEAIDDWVKKTRAVPVEKEWSTECISRYDIIPVSSNYLLNVSTQDVLQLGFPQNLVDFDDGDTDSE